MSGGGQTAAPLLGRSQSYSRAPSATIPGGSPAPAHGSPTSIPLPGHDRKRLTSAAWWARRGAGPRDALGCSCGSFKVLGGHGELGLPGLGARRSGAAETSPARSTVTVLASAARRARRSGWVQPRSPPSARPSRHSTGGGRRQERKVSLDSCEQPSPLLAGTEPACQQAGTWAWVTGARVWGDL